MVTLLCFFLALLASPFKSKSRLEAENAALRHQLIVLQRKVRGRIHSFQSTGATFRISAFRLRATRHSSKRGAISSSNIGQLARDYSVKANFSWRF
jgi:hypothetical protein